MKTRLRTLREARGLSAADLARAADLHLPSMYRLELGREKAGPTIRARVAAALDLEQDDLFDRSGWPLAAEEGGHE